MQPYRIDFNRAEGWSKYKNLKHQRKRGWWKDYGMHELARKMVALGLPDAPVETFDETGMKCLIFKSLHRMAEKDVYENDSGMGFCKHNNYWDK